MAPTSLAHSAWKSVRYHGLQVRVPVSWPVFRLTTTSTTCVRFNRHAVYLGAAGPDQICPSDGLGHTEAIQIQPASSAGASSGNPQLVLVRHGLKISATWSDHGGLIERVLGLAHLPDPSGPSLGVPSVHRSATPIRNAVRALTFSRHRSASSPGATSYTGPAFDTCAAPSAAQLVAAKRSRYRGIGLYIGGANAACAQPNLDASWIQSASAAGWHMLLIYVGLQAPGNSCGCAPIAAKHAAAEGQAAADDAAAHAVSLGVGRGSPIYFDMEGYNESRSRRVTVLRFLAAWTSELHQDGYTSGVYSSGGSGIADLVSKYGTGYAEPDDLWFADWDGQATIDTPYIPPEEWANHQRAHQFRGNHRLRIAGMKMGVDSDWVDAGTVGGSGSSAPRATPSAPTTPATPSTPSAPARTPAPSTPSSAPSPSGRHRHHFPHHHQHHRRPASTQPGAGRHRHTVPEVPANGSLVELRGTGQLFRIVGGAALFVKSWADLGGSERAIPIGHQALARLQNVPAEGSLVRTLDGTSYVIAGGHPFQLDEAAPDPSGVPLIDSWDLANLSDPLVHLYATPSDGTVVEGVPSGSYWSFQRGVASRTAPRPGAVQVPDSDLAQWSSSGSQCHWGDPDCSGSERSGWHHHGGWPPGGGGWH